MNDTYSRTGWPTDAERVIIRQNGQSEIDAQDIAMQHAYHAWLATPEGQTAAQYARTYALHMAFDRGAEAARQAHEAEYAVTTKYKARSETIRRANEDDTVFAQLCADDAEALKAHEDEAYLTRYGL